MVGAKLEMSELVTAWLAVFVMTLSAILSLLGTLILSYFNQQVRCLPWEMEQCCHSPSVISPLLARL